MKNKKQTRTSFLPVAHIAGAVFVRRTSRSSTNPINILVAFGGVLCKIDPRTKHAANVSVTLVKALMDDCVDEGRT